jgi:hypothetical protein
MEPSAVMDYARRLYAALGDQAEYEAAQKVRASTAANDHASAEDWKRIRATIRSIRGANAS